MTSNGQENALTLLWKTYGFLVLLNSVIVFAIGLAMSRYGLPFITSTFGDELYIRFTVCVLTIIACSPFLYGTVFKVPKKLPTTEASSLLRLRRLQVGIAIFRALVGLILVELIINQFAQTVYLPLLVLIFTPLFIYFFRGYVARIYSRFENRFLNNLNAKEIAEVENLARMSQLAPWNANLAQMTVSSDSEIAGQTLEESSFRIVTGATVGMIDRGRKRIFAPGRSERLLPNDELFVIGTEDQIFAAQQLVQPDELGEQLAHDELYNLESITISAESRFAKRTIKEIGLGSEFSGLIVGIERGTERILNPESSVALEPGDLVWIFGHKTKIRELKDFGL